jgi:peptide/nickel transport system ATP-binding protein
VTTHATTRGATTPAGAGLLDKVSASSEGPLLEAVDVRTHFLTDRGVLRAVDGVSLELGRGETLGIVGESGSGKSVLVRTLMNLLPPNARVPEGSRITFDGRDVRTMPRHELRHFWGRKMAMVFQDPMTSLNPVRRIGAQVTDSLRFHMGMNRHDAKARAVELLREVGIPEPARRLDQYPHELSGGMRQRVTIAIALSCEPQLLVADEPTTALDVTVQKQILDLLAGLQSERQMAMILVTHDLGVVSGYTDRVAVMYAGRIVEVADTATLFAHVEHPYTAALLASIPRLDQPSHTRLDAIGGRPPDLVATPGGCRFEPRCRHARPECTQVEPALVDAPQPGHRHRCLFPVGDNASTTTGEPSTTTGEP